MSEQLLGNQSLQIVVFSLSHNDKKERYGVEINQVKEIRELDHITKVPNSPKFLEGIINLRGQIIPVINIKEKLGFAQKQKDNYHFVLIGELKESFAGFLVDEVEQVMRIPLENIEYEKTELIKTPYMKGVAKKSEKIIVILDLEKILNDTDISVIKEKS